MGRNWKQWATDRGLGKWFRRDNLIILVLTGILLVIIALPTRESGKDSDSGHTGAAAAQSDSGAPSSGAGAGGGQENAPRAAGADEEYAACLEERLTEALSQMAEVGKVKVMITLKSSSEVVVEKEQPIVRSSTNEHDSQGGSRIVTDMDSEERTVYRTEGSSSEPYVVMTLPPRIEGVLVVAEGAGSGTVNRTIVEIAEALFGVEAHKVKVVKMQMPE